MSEESAGGDAGAENDDHSEAESLLAGAIGDDDNEGSGDDAAGRIAEMERQLAEWKGHARKHEDRVRELSKQLKGAKSTDDRVAELEQAMQAAQQERDSERKQMALGQLQLRLAEADVKTDDIAGVLEMVDPAVLLKDGKPNDAAIKKFADSLIKVSRRATPDPDQGRRGGAGPVDMNTLIRRAAGVIT